jgi:tetratricopeptide (TPR) repeat protein
MNLKGSSKMTPEIARELNVQDVIEGSVQREGSRVRIDVQLVDGRKDRPIWARTYFRDLNSVLNLQGEVAADIVREVTAPISSQEKTYFARIRSTNADAQVAYMRGLLLLNTYKDKDALSDLQQAVKADPQLAQAHAALAECMGRLAVAGLKPNRDAFTAQKSEALEAISLDPSLAEPHAELADAVMALDRDWQTAGQEYRQALELNQNSSEIHQKYALFLIFQGRTKEAINEVDVGTNLDPTSAFAIRNQIFVYFFARRYDKVLSLINTARSLGIHPPGTDFFLGATYTEKGQYQNSIEWYQKAQMSPHTLGHLGNVYALAGQREAAYGVINKLQSNAQNQGIGQYELALVYAGLGNKKSALEWLKRASDANDVGLLYIKVDPFLDPLRGEPEFQDLVRRTGLTP